MYHKLQYISQGQTAKEQLKNIQQALDSGCLWIQLRMKKVTPKEIQLLAEKVKHHCSEYNATYIINDNTKLAKDIDADGVHLGLQDMPVPEARKLLGDKIIGGTANTANDLQKRITEGCDYIGLGPLRYTTTKKNLSPLLGFEGYNTLLQHNPTAAVPVYAIGGIQPNDIDQLLQYGVHGICVSGLLTHQNNLQQLITTLNTKLYAIT